MGAPSDLVVTSTQNGVTTLTMNMPARLNGWTFEMMAALRSALDHAATDEATRVVILTGTDPYYCAGVNLSATVQPFRPAALHAAIVEHNQRLFEMFLDSAKPILIAANGPAIGAAVTSATLCDAIIASERAMFSTPFAALAVPPEGCSSVMFPALMGEANAARMLGDEGWKPTAAEAHEAGLIDRVVPHETLLAEAQDWAEEWIASGAQRRFRGGLTLQQLKAINAQESVAVADAFLGGPFLWRQFRFLWRKKKWVPAVIFFCVGVTRPLWALFLPPLQRGDPG